MKEAENGLWILHPKYRQALEIAGVYEILTNQSQATIKYIKSRIRPKRLYRKMKELIA